MTLPPRIAIPQDLYKALIQNQIDYYATQGNAGPYWTLLAESTIAAAFCPASDPLNEIVDRWAKADADREACEAEADAAEGDLFR